MSNSQQQRVLLCPAISAPFEITLFDRPKIGPNDVLIKIRSIGLNPVDWEIQKFGDFFKGLFPLIIGEDAAGYIEEVGQDVTTLKKGDRVLAEGLFNQYGGTFAEYFAVPAELVTKIPESMSFDQAASIPVAVATAACGLYGPPETGLELTPPWAPGGEGKYKNEGIFIIGGSGGVGQAVIQLAKLSGFHPIVVTASLHNEQLIQSLGASHVIDRHSDVVSEIRKQYPEGFGFIYDTISTADTKKKIALDVLKPGGSLILTNPADRVDDDIDANDPRLEKKRLVYVFGILYNHRELGRQLSSVLGNYLESGKIKPNNIEVIPNGLAGITEGLRRLEAKLVSAKKLVVRPYETPLA